MEVAMKRSTENYNKQSSYFNKEEQDRINRLKKIKKADNDDMKNPFMGKVAPAAYYEDVVGQHLQNWSFYRRKCTFVYREYFQRGVEIKNLEGAILAYRVMLCEMRNLFRVVNPVTYNGNSVDKTVIQKQLLPSCFLNKYVPVKLSKSATNSNFFRSLAVAHTGKHHNERVLQCALLHEIFLNKIRTEEWLENNFQRSFNEIVETLLGIKTMIFPEIIFLASKLTRRPIYVYKSHSFIGTARDLNILYRDQAPQLRQHTKFLFYREDDLQLPIRILSTEGKLSGVPNIFIPLLRKVNTEEMFHCFAIHSPADDLFAEELGSVHTMHTITKCQCGSRDSCLGADMVEIIRKGEIPFSELCSVSGWTLLCEITMAETKHAEKLFQNFLRHRPLNHFVHSCYSSTL